MSNQQITYLVGAGLGAIALSVFIVLVLAPAVTAYRRIYERLAVVFLSLYVLAALIGVGVLLGAVIVFEWPRLF